MHCDVEQVVPNLLIPFALNLYMGMPARIPLAGSSPPSRAIANGIPAQFDIPLMTSLFWVSVIADVPFYWCAWLSLSGLGEALAIWETDQHPTPYAPGVYSVSELDVDGFPARSRISWCVIASIAMAILVTSFRAGGDANIALISARPFYEAPLVVLPMIAQAEATALLILFFTVGPRFAMAKLIAAGRFIPR